MGCLQQLSLAALLLVCGDASSLGLVEKRSGHFCGSELTQMLVWVCGESGVFGKRSGLVPRAAQPWTRLSGWRTQLAHAEAPSEGTPKLPLAPCPEHPQPSHPQRFPFYIQPSQHMSSNSLWVEKGTLSEQRQAALEKLLRGKLSYPDWERSTPGVGSPNVYTTNLLADASVETQHVADRLRPKRGIVDECCKRPCSLDTLMSYCNNN